MSGVDVSLKSHNWVVARVQSSFQFSYCFEKPDKLFGWFTNIQVDYTLCYFAFQISFVYHGSKTQCANIDFWRSPWLPRTCFFFFSWICSLFIRRYLHMFLDRRTTIVPVIRWYTSEVSAWCIFSRISASIYELYDGFLFIVRVADVLLAVLDGVRSD